MKRIGTIKGTSQQKTPHEKETELLIASLDDTLPLLDLHGQSSFAVAFELEHFLYRSTQKFVRIIYGYGTGRVRSEVLRLLEEMQKNPKGPVESFAPELKDASCIVKIR